MTPSGDGTQTRRCVVQFLHPGSEARPGADGSCRWDRADRDHVRKFVHQPGRFMDDLDAQPIAAELEFWAEWEAQSEAVPVTNPVLEGPRWIHRPYVDVEARWSGADVPAQNTDPFVFGDRFFYTGCKQWRRDSRGVQRPTQLRDLARGSLILFGSKLHGRFVLDTVFVVADSVLHTSETWHDALRGTVSDTYRHVMLEPWYGWGGSGPYRLHIGATIDDPVDEMFSFFPTHPTSPDRPRGFPRPEIALAGVVNPNLMMHSKLTRDPDPADVRAWWESVALQVTTQRLCLGVAAELPDMR